MFWTHYYKVLLLVLFSLIACINIVSEVWAESLQWERVQGDAIDIAVSPSGSVAAVDKNGRVFRYNYDSGNWTLIGRNMNQIAVGNDGAFIAVDVRGNVRRFTGTQWISIGSGAKNLAIASNGDLYVSTNQNMLAVLRANEKKWEPISGSGADVDADSNGLIWRVDVDGSISRRLDDAWIGVSGLAKDLDIDQNGRIFVVQNNGILAEWNEQTGSWDSIKGITDVASVSINDTQIWATKKNGDIFVSGLKTKSPSPGNEIIISKPGDGGATDPSEIIDTSPIIFEFVSDNTRLEDLAIGQDGSVFGLTSLGDILRWSNNENRFNAFPGRLEKLVIQDSGLPLGIGTNNNLLEHDGEAWRQINLAESLIDITVFENDRILALNTDEKILKISEIRTAFEQLGGPRAQQIAAKNDGSFWIIDNVNRLFKCSGSAQCERQASNAADISIGPAGSVFIIDTNNNLRRFNSVKGEFDLIRQGNTVSVAVGPKDRPWIIDGQGRVLQSGYFERDESRDRILAIKTEATEKVTTEKPNVGGNNTGIQIVTSISFNAVDVPTSAVGFPDLGSGLLDITSGRNDVVLATGFSDPCIEGTGRNWLYNPNDRSFVHLDYLQRANIFNAVASETLSSGDLTAIGLTANDTKPPVTTPDIEALYMQWQENCTTPALLTYADSVFTNGFNIAENQYQDALFDTAGVASSSADIDVAANNVVVNVDGINTLRFFQPGVETIFANRSDLSFKRVGIGKDQNDLWVTNTANNVYELNPDTDEFELRSVNPDDKAQDIGVGHDGSVFIVNLSGVLKKWDETSQNFTRINKTGVTRVAVDSNGKPIVANFPSSQTVFFAR